MSVRKLLTILLLFLLPNLLLSQENNSLSISDERFIATNGDVEFTTGSDITPLLNKTDIEPNIEHRGVLTYYRWHGLELRLFRDYLDIGLITITSNPYYIKSGVRIGDTKDEVVSKNGNPDVINGNLYVYLGPRVDDEIVFTLNVEISQGIVKSLEISTAR